MTLAPAPMAADADAPLPALISAAIAADLEAVCRCLLHGGDIDAVDGNGSTALIHAALQGHRAVVERLLEGGAAVDRANCVGESALLLAAARGHDGVVECLVAAGADIAAALHRAVVTGQAEATGLLARRSPEATAVRHEHGLDVLTLAVVRGDPYCLDKLLEAGADPDTRDDAGNTPLAHAALAGRIDLIDRLLNAGAPLDRPSRHGETALSLAIMHGRADAARHLAAAGADVRYAYAYIAAIGTPDQERAARAILPPDLRERADGGRLAVALADDDSLAALRARGDVLVGVTLADRSLERCVTMNALPATVGRLLVENVPVHLQMLLRHIALDGLLDRDIVLIERRADGGFDERPMIFDPPSVVAAHDGYEMRLPLGVEVEPINWSNLRCRYCHVSFMDRPPIRRLDPGDLEHLAALKDCFVQVGAAFEPTLNKSFSRIIDFFRAGNCEISVISNATLLTDEMIEALVRANLYSVQISFDAGTKGTYESIRRNSDFDTATANIAKLRRRLRESGKDTFILLSVVLMRSNIDELPACIDLAEELGASLLGFQFMVTRFDDGTDGLIDESLDPILPHAYRRLDEAAEYAIANRKKILIGGSYYAHTPLRQRYPDQILNGLVVPDPQAQPSHYLNKYVHLQIGHHPRMGHNCVSPYTFARIHADGDVSVCRDFILGNVKQARFEDIWFGRAAHFVREFLVANPIVCAHCEHYKFCLQPATVNIDDPNHMGNNVDRTSDVAERLRGRRLSNDLAAAEATSPWLRTLFEAIARGDDDVVDACLTGPEAADAVDRAAADGSTALMFAVLHARSGAVERLLARGAEVNRLDHFGNGPLALALARDNGALATLLLAHGADRDAALAHGVAHDAIELVRRALAIGADPNRAAPDGTPLVHMALARSNVMMTKLLIESGANPDARDHKGMTPLMRAAAAGVDWLVALLLDRGADIDAYDLTGSSALQHAASQRRAATVDHLLARGASLTLSTDAPRGVPAAEQIDWRDASGATPLQRAVSLGLDLLAQRLLDRGADVDAADHYGMTALMRAAAGGLDRLAEALLDRRADIDALDHSGSTVLIHAAVRGAAALSDRLIAVGADPGHANASEQDAAHIAARDGHFVLAERFIAAGADAVRAEVFARSAGDPAILERFQNAWERRAVETAGEVSEWLGALFTAIAGDDETAFAARMGDNRPEADPAHPTGDGVTPLMLAAALGHDAMVRRLLDRGAPLDARDRFSNTALSLALARRRPALADRLVDQGADVQHALLRGIIADHTDIVCGALARGADVTGTDPLGCALLFRALSRGRAAAAAALIEAGAPVNVRDRRQRTPLIWAAAIPSADHLIAPMLDRGADPDAVDEAGHSFFDYLQQRGRVDLAARLRQRIAPGSRPPRPSGMPTA